VAETVTIEVAVSKPFRSAMTAYVPGSTLVNEKRPCSSVVVRATTLRSLPSSWTCAPAIGLSRASLMVPVTVPGGSAASASPEWNAMTSATNPTINIAAAEPPR
jgi:hypothetical protein